MRHQWLARRVLKAYNNLPKNLFFQPTAPVELNFLARNSISITKAGSRRSDQPFPFYCLRLLYPFNKSCQLFEGGIVAARRAAYKRSSAARIALIPLSYTSISGQMLQTGIKTQNFAFSRTHNIS